MHFIPENGALMDFKMFKFLNHLFTFYSLI